MDKLQERWVNSCAKIIYDFLYENDYAKGSSAIFNFVDPGEPERDGARDAAFKILGKLYHLGWRNPEQIKAKITETLREIAKLLEKEASLEKCDPDTEPYHLDYYWFDAVFFKHLIQTLNGAKAAKRIAKVPVNNLAQDITLTITITGMGKYKVRLWMARQLIKLASWICGFGILIIKEKEQANG